jgi:hypothetical protein
MRIRKAKTRMDPETDPDPNDHKSCYFTYQQGFFYLYSTVNIHNLVKLFHSRFILLLLIIIIMIHLFSVEEEYFFEVAEAVFVGWFTFLK